MSDIAVGTIEQFQEAARDVVRADLASMIGTQLTPPALASALADLLGFAKRVCNGGDCSRPGACVGTHDAIARAESVLSAYHAQSDGETGGAK